MADTPTPPPATPPSAPSPTAPSPTPQTNFRIGEEFGTARRNLPPAGIVLLCLVVVAIIVGVFSYFHRAQPQGTGSIDVVNAVDVPGQNIVMVAVTVTLRNSGEKPLWIHTLKVQLTGADGKTLEDEAASSVDFARYFQAFPALKENTAPALTPEAKLLPGTEQKGTVIVTFPVTKEAFDQRKSVAVTIQPYDQPLPVVLTK